MSQVCLFSHSLHSILSQKEAGKLPKHKTPNYQNPKLSFLHFISRFSFSLSLSLSLSLNLVTPHCIPNKKSESRSMVMAECEFELEEKSWHLLALLLRIGHTVYPQRLAAECRLFTASPDFVCYVSSLPGSPLSVTDNGLVTPSLSAVFALGSFFSLRLSPEPQTNSRKRKLLFDTAEGASLLIFQFGF